MLNISTNVGRAPVDGADAQSRWSNNGDNSRSDRDAGGFDDVFSQVNRSAASSGAGAGATGPQGSSNGTPSGQKPGAAPGGLADLLARAKAGSTGATALTPADATRAGALADDGASGAAASGAADAEAGESAALDTATADLAASMSPTGQTVAPVMLSPSTLVTLAGIEAADAKSKAASADPTSGAATGARRPKTIDTTDGTTTAPMDAANSILAALLVAQGAAPAPAPLSTGTFAPPANGKKAGDVAAASSDDETASDLPDATADAIEPADASIEPMPSTLLDSQVALRPAEGDRTLVSVVAQATHFPVVERLSLTQQLATPIAEAAKGIADTPTTSASTAPMRTLDVTLSPGDLGSVTISMRLVGGSLHLGVEAQEAGTARLIERDKATLANALHASGYSVADLTIVHGAEASGQTQSGGNNASQDQHSLSGNDMSGADTSGGGAGRGRDDGSFSGDGGASQQSRSNGESSGGASVRAERGVYV